MLLSYNWLKELLPELTGSPAEIAETLTLHSFEVGISGRIHIDDKVTVARIEAIDPHPNADRLRLVTITDDTNKTQVVCGARNISVGDIVPFSPVGTKLTDEDGQAIILKEAKIRGVASPGMLNSPRELGLGESHAGIYLLPADTPVGSRLNEHIPDDTILDADITPNRAHDCLSHVGVARELAALLNLSWHQAEASLPSSKPLEDWSLTIADPQQAPRYFGAVLTNITVQPSPLWLQTKLIAAGVRPINNVVDVTNYVMLATGNPIHAFDAAKLPGKNIGVRLAKSGEGVTTLNGKSQTLTDQNLIITSDDKPVAVAGVIGCADSEVDDNTKEIFLEIANFKPFTIQLSATALKIITESSRRFSRGLTPELINQAGHLALQLLKNLAGAELIGFNDHYPRQTTPPTIDFNPARVSAVAGADITVSQSQEILTRLGCRVNSAGDSWQVTVPSERLDLQGEHDLVEEVIRVVGLNKIPSAKLISSDAQPLADRVILREFIRDELVAAGFTETYNYSFEDDRLARLTNFTMDKPLTITNPIAPDQSHLRQSLLPRLVGHLIVNKAQLRRKKSEFTGALFEVGKIFTAGDGGPVAGVNEQEQIAGVCLEAVNVRETLTDILNKLDVSDHILTMGEINQTALANIKLELPVIFFTIDFDKLVLNATLPADYQPFLDKKPIKYEAPDPYPAAYRDLSLLVEPRVSAELVQEIIEREGGEVVADVDLFDEFTGPDNAKSLAFHITYQSSDKTLSGDEVSIIHNKIIIALQEELSAVMRD
ncbi:MAG: phenylalanine--tRNA ligase subunit beta [bacterium]|nr:phenylalanine--tRNA ligase subunit beta [bacterium]MDZ4343693.1 phenylalanine--tRNA ligase subunit beta [Candidatus Binatia bacterium]